jgi:hypothetical protein
VPRETVIFFALNGIGLLIQDGVVGFNEYVLGLDHNKLAGFLALNTGIAIATVFRFWSYRRFVWTAPVAEAAAAAVAAAPVPPEPGARPVPGPPAGAGPVPGTAHPNGHSPAGRAAGDGSFSRR